MRISAIGFVSRSIKAMLTSDVRSAKKLMRREVRQKLKLLSTGEVDKETSYVLNALERLPQMEASQHIGIYVSMGGEIGTERLIRSVIALRPRKVCYVPYIPKDLSDMRMMEVQSENDFDTFVTASYGAKQPAAETLSARKDGLEAGAIDTLVMPGLAFDSHNRRLGHGAGFYDRFVAKLQTARAERGLPPAFLVGLALRAQMVPEVPVTETDIPLDLVLRMPDDA